MNHGVCKLVGVRGKYVDAHIVPKAFYAPLGTVRAYVSDGSARPKRMPIGLYDSQLVVEQTERDYLAPLDDEGIRFLRQELGEWLPLTDDNVCNGWLVRDINYAKIKLFFLSVLWRAAASSRVQPPLEKEGLEAKLRAMLLANAAGSRDDFAVSLIRYRNVQSFPVMVPKLYEVDDTVGAVAMFGGCEIIYYLDRPSTLVEPERLLADSPFVILERDWFGSRPHGMLLDLARSQST